MEVQEYGAMQEHSGTWMITPRFGKNYKPLGSEKETVITTRVDRIRGIKRRYIGITEEQSYNLRSEFGKIKILNLENKKSLEVKVKRACKSLGEQKIDVSHEVANELNLSNKSWVEVTRTMDAYGKLLWDCKYDKKNPFGQDWDTHAYVATAVLTRKKKDKIPGRCEIYLSDIQLSYLLLTKHLRPLCGENKAILQKKISLLIRGMVIVQHGNKAIEADVYRAWRPGAAIAISESLDRELGGCKIADEILISSRFDIEDLRQTESLSVYPKIRDFSKKNDDYFEIISSFSVEELKVRFRESPDEWGIDKASCFESLSHQVEKLIQIPELLLKTLEIFISLESKEYEFFLDSIRMHNSLIKENWDIYMEMIGQKIQIDKHETTKVIENFVGLGFCNQQNSKGETLLHLFGKFNLFNKYMHGNLFLHSNIAPDFNIKNIYGETPFHYFCSALDWMLIECLGESNKIKLDVNIQDNFGKTPLHFVMENYQSMEFDNQKEIQTDLTIKYLQKYFPEIRESFYVKDYFGITPMDYFEQHQADIAG